MLWWTDPNNVSTKHKVEKQSERRLNQILPSCYADFFGHIDKLGK